MNEMPLLRRPQVAELLNVSIRTVDYLLAAGELPCIRIGRSVRVRRSAVEFFVEARETRHWERRRRRRS
ncbi:helix-turn-helix transcriptional regulator [Haloferula sp. A504]|uniref:helix-turn-helix transcriptional regulator n=1 Tax=Haloferula sp. A504 TaxID=3373601 RepID=UPI00379384D6